MWKLGKAVETDDRRKKNWKLTTTFAVVAAVGAFAVVVDSFASRSKPTLTATRPIGVEARLGTLESPSGFKAFIVGADKYRNASKLKCVRNDVERIAARLIKLGFDKKDIVVLKTSDNGDYDYYPDKDNIETRFKAFVDNLEPGDFCFVYFSGHGLQSVQSGESFFAPINVKAEDPFGSSVSIDNMLKALEKSQARFRWMIVDACRNDPTKGSDAEKMWEIFPTRPLNVKSLTNIAFAPEATSLLQSCQPGRLSYEIDENGVFTTSLLEAFDSKKSRADLNDDGLLAFSEVLEYVENRTNELAWERYGVTQKPCRTGDIPDFAILSVDRGLSVRFVFGVVALIGGVAGLAGLAFGIGRRRGDEVCDELQRNASGSTSKPKDGWDDACEAGTRKTLSANGIEYALRHCPPGTFQMGSPKDEPNREDDETLHSVTLTNPFWTLETPVTQAMWKSVMGSNPSYFSSTGQGANEVDGMNTANFPVEQTSWEDCQIFIAKLNEAADLPSGWFFRLPTEAEWEYACRAGTTTPFPWGDALNGDRANCDGNYPCGTTTKGRYLKRTTEVGSYPANRWGLVDMTGNVWEWCADWYGEGDTTAQKNPTGPASGQKRVLRGGSWRSNAQFARSANRNGCDPKPRVFNWGFRIVLVRKRDAAFWARFLGIATLNWASRALAFLRARISR